MWQNVQTAALNPSLTLADQAISYRLLLLVFNTEKY